MLRLRSVALFCTLAAGPQAFAAAAGAQPPTRAPAAGGSRTPPPPQPPAAVIPRPTPPSGSRPVRP
jgi:hypothetical protein